MKCNINNNKSTQKDQENNSFMKDLSENFDKYIINLSDEFTTGCRNCTGCCTMMGQDIILNPLDAYNAAKVFGNSSDIFAIKTTLALGYNSKVPLMMLSPTTVTKHCPMLKNGQCKLGSRKPTSCAIYPIGRSFYGNSEYSPENIRYFLPRSRNNFTCNKGSNKKYTVEEWLKLNGVPVQDPFFCDWMTAAEKIGNKIETLENMLDEETFNKVLGAVWYTLYTNYDLSDDFYPQFSEKLEDIYEYLEWNLEGRIMEDIEEEDFDDEIDDNEESDE